MWLRRRLLRRGRCNPNAYLNPAASAKKGHCVCRGLAAHHGRNTLGLEGAPPLAAWPLF